MIWRNFRLNLRAILLRGGERQGPALCNWPNCGAQRPFACPKVRGREPPLFSMSGRWLRPRRFPQPAAEMAQVIAAGELSALFAGPPGSGKSTLVEAIPAWLEEPSLSEFETTQRLWRRMGHRLNWRPVVQPHHSTTALAMTGGGATLWTGEIARAHGGVLILDEMLEFNPQVQEALREPVETGVLTIARSGRVRKHPAQILLLGTTNLCKCGLFVPGSR